MSGLSTNHHAMSRNLLSNRTSNYSGSEASNTEAVNAQYQFPDDSEFCESIESFSKLRKRPSNTILESTSKRSRNTLTTDCKDEKLIGIDGRKNVRKSSGAVESSNNSPQIPGNDFIFGNKHEMEGTNKRLEDAIGTTNTAGRFTKHKGDSKCHHGIADNCVTACSSDEVEADVEDNADDSDTVASEGHQASPRKVQTSQKQKQKTAGKDIKSSSSNSKAKELPKSMLRPLTVSDRAVMKSKKPGTSKTVENTAEKSNQSTSETSSPEAKRVKVGSNVKKQNKRRCGVCEKKLGLTAISCRCGGTFCSKHRYDKEHNCTFDYKSMGAEEIRRNNPKVVAEKVKKI